MNQPTRAERLRITGGTAWIIGRSVEENSLLDPVPEGVEVITERSQVDEDAVDEIDDEPVEDEHVDVTAAVLVIDDAAVVTLDLDETLPRVTSVPAVWVAWLRETDDADVDRIETALRDYGWEPVERLDLDDVWSAVRIEQS